MVRLVSAGVFDGKGFTIRGLKFDLFSKDYRHRLNVYTSAQHTKRDSYYGAGHDPNAYGHTTDMTFIGGAQYSYDWDKCLFMPATFTLA